MASSTADEKAPAVPATPDEAHTIILRTLESGDVEAATALFERASNRWPRQPKLLLLKGDVLARQHGPAEAAFHYATLLDANFGTWAANRLLSLLRENPLNFSDAEKLTRLIVEANAELKLKTPALDILVDRKDAAEREQLVQFLGLQSGIFRYEWKLAVHRAERGEFEGALSILEEAQRHGRTTALSAALMADLLALESRLPEAIELLESVRKQHADQPDIYRRLTMFLQRAGEFERAAQVFEDAARRWPHDWMLVHRLNRLPIRSRHLEQITEIISDGAEEALAKNDRFRFQFSLACLHAGKVERGFELLRRPFQEPVATMSVPVLKALSARPLKDWTSGSRLKDDRTLEVQITRATDARATIILLTGIAFGYLPLALVDTLFADHGLNVIYLRDFQRRAYLRGIATLGSSESETISALAKLVDELGAKRTIAMGSSSGGFSALRCGALIEADVAVSFSGPTLLGSVYDDTRVSVWNPDFFIKAILAREEALPIDLVPVLSQPLSTRFRQYYGADDTRDAKQASRLEGIPGVALYPTADVSDHYVVDHMIGDGTFDTLLEELANG